MSMIQDDMEFKPYPMGGFQCIMETKLGKISVRTGKETLITSTKKPYEVWYPTNNEPTGYQDANDIWNYIRNIK